MYNTPSNPPYLEYKIEYGEANLHYALYETLNQNYNQALIYIENYLNIFPNDVNGFYNKAVILYFLKEYDESLRLLLYTEKITEEFEILQDSYYYIALISKEFGYGQAIIDYCEKALLINPQMFEAYFEKAVLYFENKNYYKSLIEIKYCINCLLKSKIPEKNVLVKKIKEIKTKINSVNNLKESS